MNGFQEKLASASVLFALSLQKIMEGKELPEAIANKYEENPDMSIEELQKVLAIAVIDNLSKVYKNGGENNE